MMMTRFLNALLMVVGLLPAASFGDELEAAKIVFEKTLEGTGGAPAVFTVTEYIRLPTPVEAAAYDADAAELQKKYDARPSPSGRVYAVTSAALLFREVIYDVRIGDENYAVHSIMKSRPLFRTAPKHFQKVLDFQFVDGAVFLLERDDSKTRLLAIDRILDKKKHELLIEKFVYEDPPGPWHPNTGFNLWALKGELHVAPDKKSVRIRIHDDKRPFFDEVVKVEKKTPVPAGSEALPK